MIKINPAAAHLMGQWSVESKGFADARSGNPNVAEAMPEHWREHYNKGYQDGLKPESEELPF